MSKRQETIWKAEPHTLAKLQILSRYLKAYFPILGRTRPGEEILIIDGFAGPGEYKNHPTGSPQASVECAVEALAGAGYDWKAGRIHLAFIEEDKKRFLNLKGKIEELRATLPANVVPHLYHATFEVGVEQIKAEMPKPFATRAPLFVFIDPFGVNGAPFSLVSNLLNSQCSEILLNFDADGIARVHRAGERALHEENLTKVFGDDSWRDAITSTDFHEQGRQAWELYIAKLRSLPRIKYVYSFAMHTTDRALNYYLVFASQHHLGLVKMKESMRALDQDGSFKFSDDRHLTGQTTLFRSDDVEEYAPLMHSNFSEQRITYQEALDYALNYTPFVNPKKCLTLLESEKKIIEVEAKNPKRRKGTFAEDDIIAITFAPYSPGLF